jgi:ribokinase
MKAGKIVVFGSFVVDLTSWADHLPVPGETIKGSVFKMGPGGKGSNQGVAASRSGADVTLVTKVGNDVFGQTALAFYKNESMTTDYVFIDAEKETGTALIMVDEKVGQNQILVVSGACDNILKSEVEQTFPLIDAAEIVLLQLEVNMDAIEKVVDYAHAKGKMIVLNTAPARKLPESLLAKLDIVTPNEIEAGILTDMKVETEADAEQAARILMNSGVKNVVVTMGKSGVFVMTPERSEMIPSMRVKAIDTTGAGDAFNGGFVTALSEGKDIFEAARFGNAVGALSVTKIGTAPAMPHRSDIDQFMKENTSV